MILLDHEQTGGSNIFTIVGDGPQHGRAFGAQRDKVGGRWVYPAYAPVGQQALADLRKIFGETLTLTPAAERQSALLASVADAVANRTLPDVTLPVPPFEHQLEGLAYLYHNPRWALLWEPGVGKTKVLVDLKQMLPGKRMLVLAPRVVVSTWLKEVAFHSKGALKAVAVEGSAAKKKSIIRDYKNYDVLIATYGTARTMGFPNLSQKAMKVLESSGRLDVRAASGVIRKFGTPAAQLTAAQRWIEGTSLRQIESEMPPQPASWLSDIDYDIIVADESHNIKLITSQQTKAALALSVKAERRYVMSGTPALGDPRHLFPQIKFLAPALMPEDWFAFSEKFLMHSAYNKHIVTGFKNLHIINQRVDKIAIRKRKDECLDLPDRHIVDVPFELTGEQKKMYNSLIADMSAQIATYVTSGGTSGMVEAQNAAVRLNKLSQVVSGFVYTAGDVVEGIAAQTHHFSDNPKLDAISELFDTIFEDPAHKVIVWCVYTPELDAVLGLLTKKNVGAVRLDGSNSGKSGAILKKFETDPDCRVLVGQIGTGVGFTANAAAYTIYYSLDWSLDKYLQSIDRNYRAGQTRKVTVYRLIAEGTVDYMKAKALDRKQDISTLMTQKATCVTCARQVACAEEGVELFKTGCLYRLGVSRPTAKPKALETEEESDNASDATDERHDGNPE